jgi:iron complex transport system substrate-binding protein
MALEFARWIAWPRVGGAVRRWLPLLLLATLLIAAACADDDDGRDATSTPVPTATAAEGSAATPAATSEPEATPITLIDPTGAEVTLEGPPERIGSFSPAVTEILFAIGAGDAVVVVDRFSNFPEAAAELPMLSAFPELNVEALLAHDPQLVVLTGGNQGEAEQLRQLDTPVLFLDGATSIEGIYTHIDLLGQATGHRSEAEALVAQIRARIDELETALAAVDEGPTVYYELDPGLFTVGPGSFIAELLTILKVRNIAADAESPFPLITAEAIIDASPEVVILADAQFGETAEAVSARPGWDAIAAVRENRIIEIEDADIVSRPGPRVGEALAVLARLLYPELEIP